MKLRILLIILLMPTLSICQEKDRIGIRIGYQNDLFGLKLNTNDYKSQHNQFNLGFEWVGKHLQYKHFVWGLDFGISNHSNYSSNSYNLSIHTGKRTYFGKRKYFNYYGILLEYDFNAPNEDDHLRQNGLGIYYSIGREIELNEKRILAIIPMIRLSGFPLFNKGNGKENDYPVAGGMDWGIKISLQRIRIKNEELE